MINMFASAEYTYVNFGSDIGGFRSDTGSYGPNGRTKELFLRWAQMGALVPLMENGGNNEVRTIFAGGSPKEDISPTRSTARGSLMKRLSRSTACLRTCTRSSRLSGTRMRPRRSRVVMR